MSKKKSQSEPLLANSTFVLHRTIVISTSECTNRKINSSVAFTLQSIKEPLRRRINELNIACHGQIPSLSIDVKANNPDLNKIRGIRVVASAETLSSYTISAEYCEEFDISHLIEIVVSSRDQAENSKENINAVYSVADNDELKDLVMDIMTDIAMFHSWPFFHDRMDDIEFRRQISERKVAFAQANNLTCPYKVISDVNCYFSFAYSCHEGDKFNYETYEDFWQNFIKEYIIEEQPDYQNKKPIEQQLRYFKKIPQTSIKKIQKEYDSLKTVGPHILLVTASKPKREKDTTRILVFFGKNTWKNGAVKIVPLGDYSKIARFHPYVAFYKIVK